MGAREVARAVQAHPQVLHYRIPAMRKRVEFLAELGLSPEQAAEIFSRIPQAFSLDVEANMRPKVEVCVYRCVHRCVLGASFPLTCPGATGLPTDPSTQYLMTQMGATTETLVKYPGILSLSLANRIVPRHKFMSEVGYPIIHPLPNNLLKCSDLEFTAKLGASLEAYSEFKARVANRLTQEGLS